MSFRLVLTPAECQKLIASGQLQLPGKDGLAQGKKNARSYVPKGRGTADGRPPGTIKAAALEFFKSGADLSKYIEFATERRIDPCSFRATLWKVRKEHAQ